MNDPSPHHDRFLRLFTANEPAIRAFVRRLVPTRADAADVMQEVSLVLWRKFDRTLDGSDFRKWAFGVARYETLAWLRDKARDRHVLAQDVLEVLATEAAQNETRLEAQREALEDCLGKLRVRDRELVVAAYAPDARMQQVAERSGRTLSAFYQWLHRTRQRLVQCTRRALVTEGLT